MIKRLCRLAGIGLAEDVIEEMKIRKRQILNREVMAHLYRRGEGELDPNNINPTDESRRYAIYTLDYLIHQSNYGITDR